jgi:hypothetical protein
MKRLLLEKILKLKIYLKKNLQKKKETYKLILREFKCEFYAFYYQDLKLLKKNENSKEYKNEYKNISN